MVFACSPGGMVTLVFLALQYVTEETWLAHYFQNLPIPPAGSAARWHFLRHTWRMGRELLSPVTGMNGSTSCCSLRSQR